MCVIAVCEDHRPNNETLEKMAKDNPHGAGVAWREEVEGKLLVHWKKGMDIEEVKKFLPDLPYPFVLHFRKMSDNCGGDKPSVCHPFPISKLASTALEGRTNGLVLFHNGFWSRWREYLLEYNLRHDLKFPASGLWSDTRALAFLSTFCGHGLIEIIGNQKAVVFGPEDLITYRGDGWFNYEGMLVSNTRFITPNYYQNVQGNHRVCLHPACNASLNLDTDQRCPKHSLPPPHPIVVNGGGGVKPSEFRAALAPSAGTQATSVDDVGEPGGVPTVNPFPILARLHHEGRISGKDHRRTLHVFAVIREEVNRMKKALSPTPPPEPS